MHERKWRLCASALNTIEAEGPAAAGDVAPLAFDLARDERDPVAASRALANIPREGYTDSNSVPFPHAWFEGLVAKLRQDAAAAQSAFTARAIRDREDRCCLNRGTRNR